MLARPETGERYGSPWLKATVSLMVEGARIYAGPVSEPFDLMRNEHELSLADGLALARALGIEAEVKTAVNDQAIAMAENARARREAANDAHHTALIRAGEQDAEATRVLVALRAVTL